MPGLKFKKTNVKQPMVKPSSLSLSRQSWLARENKPTNVAVCKAENGVPKSQITWTSNNEVIQRQISKINALDKSILRLNLTREENGAFVTCRAYHPLYDYSFVESTLELRKED